MNGDNIYYAPANILCECVHATPISNPIIICEDAEEYVLPRRNGGKISELLNLSDGLLSDQKVPKFIFTLNSNVTDIDEAILRKGRLHGSLKFEKLEAKKADALLQSIGKPPQGIDMTLADIFNGQFGDIGSELNTKKVIGFGRA